MQDGGHKFCAPYFSLRNIDGINTELCIENFGIWREIIILHSVMHILEVHIRSIQYCTPKYGSPNLIYSVLYSKKFKGT